VSGWRGWLAALLPLALLGVMIAWFTGGGNRLFALRPAPIEKIAFERVEFRPQEIALHVRNEGPGPVSVGQLFVNEGIWDFSIAPGRRLERLQGAVLTIPYDWIEG
jgi:hypothetical protein